MKNVNRVAVLAEEAQEPMAKNGRRPPSVEARDKQGSVEQDSHSVPNALR